MLAIINYKTILLPVAILLPLLNIFPLFYNHFYIIFSTFCSLMILTWNFPCISKYSYHKPIYIEDLDSELKVKKKIYYNITKSKKFTKKFLVFQQFILSITICIVVEYIIFKYNKKNYQLMEFFGLIGGIFSLYLKITRYIGQSIINILYNMKKKEKEKLLLQLNIKSNNNSKNKEIEI